jgi:hypothetical protein
MFQKFRYGSTLDQYYDEIEFPESSPEYIIVKCNEKGTGLLRTCYNQRFCEGRIEKEEFDGVVGKSFL